METLREWVEALVAERCFESPCPVHHQPRDYFSFALLKAVCYSCDGRPDGVGISAPVVSCFVCLMRRCCEILLDAFCSALPDWVLYFSIFMLVLCLLFGSFGECLT